MRGLTHDRLKAKKKFRFFWVFPSFFFLTKADGNMQTSLEVNVPKQEAPSETDDEADTPKKKPAEEEEDVSERWNDQKRQQAVETLLGSCAGSDFVETAEPPQVRPQSML